MKKTLFFALIVLLTACNQSGKFSVSGNITDAKDKMLYFEKTGLVKDSLIDSVKLNAAGSFKFKSLREKYPDLYRLRIDNQRLVLGIDSTEKIEISGSGNNLIEASITGSDQSVEIQKLRQSVLKLQAEVETIQKEKDAAKAKSMIDSLEQHINAHKARVKEMILSNPRTMAAYFALYQQIGTTYLFSPYNKDDRPYFSAVATTLNTYMPEYDRSKNIYTLVMDAIRQDRLGKQKLSWENIQNSSASGFIDIDLKDVRGVSQKLSALSGKVIVLDFSLFENENSVDYTFALRDIYNQYASRGLQIYQVSLDRNKMLWAQSVVNLPWICVLDENQKAAGTYNVQSLPTLFLINKEGTILGRYTNIKALSAEIGKVL